ncbi:MAG: ABC transporter permease [Planctomycetota bacterium]|nr:ABC transporter permease [Planctomycetota bacterium]MDA1211445.1 ABC transporter permease [Planctomycetota bacterium]
MSFFRFFRTVHLALKSILLHKLRSGLTMLGIVFGVFSVIAMLAIGEGASEQAQQQVLQLGATNIIVRSVKPPLESSGSNNRVNIYGLLRSDFQLLSENIPTLVNAIPIRESTMEFRNKHHTLNGRLVGCTADYAGVNHLKTRNGRFIDDRDQETMANVCVLGADVADILFPLEQPVGKAVQVNARFYKIIGVSQRRVSTSAIGSALAGQDFNKDIYIPIKTFQVRLGDLIIQRQQGTMTAEKVELNQITLQVGNPDDVMATADVVRETIDRNHKEQKDVDIIVPLELLRQAEQIRQIFNVVLGSIAAISLVVGGIGIMNIMLATVTERTREIGIRRALGARQRDITVQFLTETIVLTGTGGVIGIVMGLTTPYAFDGLQYVVQNFILSGSNATSEVGRIFSDMHPKIAYWSLPLAFGISVGIGIIFGLYPARAAARLDPIEALRHE